MWPEKGGEIPIKIPDEILAAVKETILNFGAYEQTIFIEGTNGKMFTHLPFGETYYERVEIMPQVGIQLAKSGKVGDVERVIFVSEAWVSPARQPYIQPSQDPNRQEVLLFNLLDAKTNREELEIYACVRNGRKDIIDLKRVSQPDGVTAAGRLLPSFLAGFKSFKR